MRCGAFAALIACHAVLGLWALRTSPDPHIDVVTVQRRAIERLAAARTPYTFTFENIYGDSRFYGEGMTSGDRVLFGLPYPPLTLAFTAPAEWSFGDLRIGHVVALSAGAVLIASMGWTAHAMLAATLLLTTPRVLFVLEQGWTEPSGVMLLALTCAMWWRRRQAAPVALGLLLASKQYLAFGVPLVPFLSPTNTRSYRPAASGGACDRGRDDPSFRPLGSARISAFGGPAPAAGTLPPGFAQPARRMAQQGLPVPPLSVTLAAADGRGRARALASAPVHGDGFAAASRS